MSNDLRVNAVELGRQPGTRRHIVRSIPLADVDIDDARLAGDVTVDVTLESTLDDIVVSGELSVAWSDECRRCLRPLADTLRVEVEERYAEPGAAAGTATVLGTFPIEHGQIDLAPMVREEVLLAIPDAPLCRDDCPGLCPVCGADLQTAPCECETVGRRRPVGHPRPAARAVAEARRPR